jgi:hypothetical protein
MGYKLNGVDSEGLPVHIVKMFTDNYQVTCFVETGTAGGDSIKIASGLFRECHTIELIGGRLLPENSSFTNVQYYIGDSEYVLKMILPKLQGWSFFFLDAHFSDSIPNTTGKKECPVLEELEIISKYKLPIILIDDARLFFNQPPAPCDPREWPRIEEIFATCKKLFPDHHTTIIDDYILCYHDHLGDAVNKEWRSRFNVRYPSAEDKLKSDAKNVCRALKNYIDV